MLHPSKKNFAEDKQGKESYLANYQPPTRFLSEYPSVKGIKQLDIQT